MNNSILYYELTGEPYYINKKITEFMLEAEEDVLHGIRAFVWILLECDKWASIPKLPYNSLHGVDMDFDSLPCGLEKYGYEIDTLPYMGVAIHNHD